DRGRPVREARTPPGGRTRHERNRRRARTARRSKVVDTISKRANARRAALRESLRVLYPALCPPPCPAPARVDRSAIVLGRNQGGAPVFLSERARLEHGHCIGTTGGGKTRFLEHCIKQDVASGRGVCVIDPHGNHPDSLYRSLLG